MVHNCYMDYDALASELIRALRGRRSQTAFSRRLGYRSNVVYPWEAGRRHPTAAEAMRAARVAGVDLQAVWAAFYGVSPPWLGRIDPASPRGIAWILSDLRGRTAIADVAQGCRTSRYAVSRWLNAQTEPKLPQFLRLFDVLSLRLLDLLAALVDIRRLPSAAAAWQRLEAQRRAAFELPWTQAVLRCLELEDYRRLPAHEAGWIARRLGIEPEQEQACLDALAAGGQIRHDGRHWQLDAVIAVDTRAAPEHGLQLKRFWAGEGLRRLGTREEDLFAYNVFGISGTDFERLRKLQLAHFRQLRTLIAESEPTERVAVINLQLFSLDG